MYYSVFPPIRVMIVLGMFILHISAQTNAPPPESLRNYKSIHQLQSEMFSDYPSSPDYSVPDTVLLRFPLQRRTGLSAEIFGYLPYWEYNSYTQLHYDLLTVVAYFSAGVNSHGGITDDHDWPASGLVNMAHQNGVKVVLTATLFNSGDIGTLLSNSVYRSNCVNNLLSRVESAGADGVNIDFEGVPSSQRNNMVLFMQELADSFRTNIDGAHISMATPAVDWSGAWDYNALANICDALFIMGYAYHYGGSSYTGPVAPLTGWGTYNITWTVNDYLGKTGNNGEKIILGVPYYGYEWPCVSGDPGAATTGSGSAKFYAEAESRALSFGKLWDSASQTPWYKFQSSGWHQGWYDDSTSLALKYGLAITKGLQGIGMWALGYDGSRQELWGALRDAFAESVPPLKPEWMALRNAGNGTVSLVVNPVTDADEYHVFISSNGSDFDSLLSSPNSLIEINNLPPDSVFYIKVRAANEAGISDFSEVGAIGTTSGYASVLIVNGFDRVNGTANTFDFVRYHAPEIHASGYAFDFASNEALTNNAIDIFDYSVVDWILGEEGTATSSFNPSEQILVKAYLRQGGGLFVSGSEIGYDLAGSTASPDDQSFYNQYFKADYIVDRVSTHSAEPSVSTIYPSISNIDFDDGSHGTYDVDYPDGIKPLAGAFRILEYTGADYETQGCAAIAYSGIFPSGNRNGALVYLAFPFETIYDPDSREYIMSQTLSFLMENSNLAVIDKIMPESFLLIENYPNPANPGTVFKISGKRLSDTEEIGISIYNVLGRLVFSTFLSAGEKTLFFTWDGKDNQGVFCSTGVYLLRVTLSDAKIVKTHKFSVLK